MKANYYRTHTCNELTIDDLGKQVKLSGFVGSIRDHGGVLFVDLRDGEGVTQIVVHNEELLKGVSKESVISVTGTVVKRDAETVNEKIKTGLIEVESDSLEVLSHAKNIPFEIETSKEVKEDTRLKYRYIDMRNSKVSKNIKLRSEILHFLRNKMYDLGFTEVQTPILTASSPEGARDFVVPSRTFKGKFYALPQAPQIYKQLLMVGGLNKYFQVAPCFRDEDARKDRTLEFYQLDFEMSFPEEKDIIETGEDIFYDVFSKYTNKEVSPKPFRQIAYKDAMEMYGTDKPDLRNPLVIKDASKVLERTTFKPFANSTIKVIVVDDIGTKPNSWFNEIVDYASSIGMPGIGYITLMEDGSLKGPIDKFLSEEERNNLIKEFDMKTNSVMFFIANRNKKVAQKFAGQIRDELGRKIGLIDENKIELCIIKDFPMFEYDEKEKKYDFCHNPFSKPFDEYKDYDKFEDLEEILAHQFDFVCNGFEMASGAIRNTDLDLITKGFVKVGYTEDVIEERFNSMFTAFKYGVPPHGGMAPGIDRILMIILDEPNLREVQTFPTSSTGQDTMMGSPSVLDAKQLDELGLKIVEEE
ncbi:MAG: aspartate--tRNA ligase [Bacilli bacterium]|nr:aspartate--tRNA ligase [Bacilli bacterium]